MSRRYLSEGQARLCHMPGFCDDQETAGIRDIAAEISACQACPLALTRNLAVPGVGPDAPLAMIIGEAPGADEDSSGEPFVGKAGQLLDKMLDAIGLSRDSNCFIANVVKCRPPQNRDPSPEETSSCSRFLDAQIDALRPAAILALGRVAAQRLLDTTVGIGHLRGTRREYRGVPLVATFHPSAILRDETLKRPAWEDLKKFRALLDELRAGGVRT